MRPDPNRKERRNHELKQGHPHFSLVSISMSVSSYAQCCTAYSTRKCSYCRSLLRLFSHAVCKQHKSEPSGSSSSIDSPDAVFGLDYIQLLKLFVKRFVSDSCQRRGRKGWKDKDRGDAKRSGDAPHPFFCRDAFI